MSPTSTVACLILFAAVGFLFLWVALLLGRLLRPSVPTPEKLQAYECGEPPVGSSFVQYDLRFYVVALVFIIFEVEVTLFFPPAVVFGKATQLMKLGQDARASEAKTAELAGDLGLGTTAVEAGRQPVMRPAGETASDARLLALAAMIDLGAFFAVILVGFAYVWWRGDLNWVRAIGRPAVESPGGEP
jgi:NADH-quinone oxidoreductase subunit A